MFLKSYILSNNGIKIPYKYNPEVEPKDVHEVNIITHNGRCHADDVIGCVLMKYYLSKELANQEAVIKIIRVPHSNSIEELETYLIGMGVDSYSYVLDTGREYDGEVYFDHHHESVESMKTPNATAGRVLKYLQGLDKETFSLIEISSLCKMVDVNDLGIAPAERHTLPYIITHLQNINFDVIVEFMLSYVTSIITQKQKKKEYICNILEHTTVLDGTNFRVQYSDSIHDDINLESWNRIVNQNDFDEQIDGILTYSRTDKKWKIHTMPLGDNTYANSGPSLPEDKLVDFVHPAGFIAVDFDKEHLLDYINRHFRKEV